MNNLQAEWDQISYEFMKFGKRFPYLTAERVKNADGTTGAWVVGGVGAAVVGQFTDLADRAARMIGFKGYGRISGMQFWLDHMNGDHVQMAPTENPIDKTRTRVVTNQDGQKEMYRYRSVYAGDVHLKKDKESE